MDQHSRLLDLCHHHAWADAEYWRVFSAFPAALDDETLFDRLHHIHLTQSAWVWAFGDRRDTFVFSKATDFSPANALKVFAIQSHAQLDAVAISEESGLDRRIAIPWFDGLELRVREGLTQVVEFPEFCGQG